MNPRPPSIEELIEAALIDAKVVPSRELVDMLTRALFRIAHPEASKMATALVVTSLPPGPGSEAVIRYLFDDGESIREAAAKIGCAPSTLLRAERRFRRFIGLCNSPETRVVASETNEPVI